jgi:NitT/TauT family transport system ATP-binding protein
VATQLQSRAQPPSDSAASEGAVSLCDVERVFQDPRGKPLVALDGVTLRAARGELVAVVGPSGCGKTTLLELICGLQQPQRGSVRSQPAALMPQHDLLLPWLDAADNAALALRIAHVPRAAARARAQSLFAELGLGGFEDATPAQLSGGMRQRVAFLRTLLSGKPVLCPRRAVRRARRDHARRCRTG